MSLTCESKQATAHMTDSCRQVEFQIIWHVEKWAMTYCIDAGNASYSSGDMVISPGGRSLPPLLRRLLPTMLRRNVFLLVLLVLLILLILLMLLMLLTILLLLAFAVWWQDDDDVGKHSGRRVADDAERSSVLDLGDDPALWNRRLTSHEPAMQAATLPKYNLQSLGLSCRRKGARNGELQSAAAV